MNSLADKALVYAVIAYHDSTQLKNPPLDLLEAGYSVWTDDWGRVRCSLTKPSLGGPWYLSEAHATPDMRTHHNS